MNQHARERLWIWLGIVLASGAIFAVDLLFPLGVAAGVPYVVVVLLSRLLGTPQAVLTTTVAVTILTVVGFFVPTPAGPLIVIGLQNRLIAIFAIWTFGIFAAVLIRRNEMIRQERDFNRRLVETAASIILLVDEEGHIVYFNPYTTDVSGRQLVDAKGKNWIDTLVPEQEQATVHQLFASWNQQASRSTAAFSIKAIDQDVCQFSWTSHVTTATDGTADSVLLIGQNITPLVEAQQQLVQSERLAAIGQTIASVSHEVHNELHSLHLATLLLEHAVLDGPALDIVARIKAIEERLRRQFEDIRGFASPIQLEPSTVSIVDVWRNAWSIASRSYGGCAEFVEQLSETCRLSLDAMRIEQVFRNLFDNSLAASPDRVCITVHCDAVHRDDRQFLLVRVHDDGPGLSAEAKRRVFRALLHHEVERYRPGDADLQTYH